MNLVLGIFISFVCSSAMASKPSPGFALTTKLDYKSGTKKDISTSKEIILSRGNINWTPLTDIQDEVILLGRVAQASDESIKVEYMLIDGHKKPSTIVSTPTLVARLNEAAQISITDPDKKSIISISLTAKAATFMPEDSKAEQ